MADTSYPRLPPSSSTPGLIALMAAYSKIGLLGFGGGFAVLAFIRQELVARRGWLTAEAFDQVVEMSALAPGATTTNVLAAIAFRLQGSRGLAVGTAAVLWPSFLLILLLAKLTQVLANPWIAGAMRGIEVAVVGLLADVVATLWTDLPKSRLTRWIPLVAAGLTLGGINPALVVLGAGLVGWGSHALATRSAPPR